MYTQCIVRLIERLMEYLNHYSFTFIAIYGHGFRAAASEVWTLLQEVGVMPMLNNQLVGAVCTLGCMIGGGIAAVIGVFMAKSGGLDGVFPLWASALLCFALGYS